jgi:hypothetical protein
VTDDKLYHPIRKLTNKIVSDMLLRDFDEKPGFGAAVAIESWINDPIESFLKTAKQDDIENINFIFQFAIDVAARKTQVPLCALTHGIVMRLKERGKKTSDDNTNFMFETTLELIHNIFVTI